MHSFNYKNGQLYCENIPLLKLAEEVGTPAYIYSLETLKRHFQVFDQAFSGIDHLTCFSVKANSNLSLLRLFSNLGGGADIVSGGELFRALKSGVPAQRIVYSGVGKTRGEIQAALEADILMYSMESSQEISLIGEVASDMGKIANVALRVNPNVDPKTHPYISTGLKKSKFGIPYDLALSEYIRAINTDGLKVMGMACHIGSQLTDVDPFTHAIEKLLELLDQLKKEGIELTHLDVGGGLGITYDDEAPPQPAEYAKGIENALAKTGLTVILEPGRVIAGNAGILLAKVLFTKPGPDKTFTIVDAAMNDLIRPSLYDSYHEILPVVENEREVQNTDIVGPICESGDFLARDRALPEFEQGELLAVMSAGAYCYTMSSNYNSRPRPAEVMVDKDKYYIIRERETLADLIKGESIPDFLTDGN